MAVIYSVQPGYAVAVKEGTIAPLRLGLQSWGDIASGAGFAQRKAIVTSIGFVEEDNYQVMQTLREFLYFHVFGRKPVPLVLGGLAFAGTCNGAGASGLDAVRQYFAENRMSRRGRPIAVTIGSIGFRAFLVRSQVSLQNPEAGIAQFSFMLQCEGTNR
jgi:hypothetical protein